MIDCINAKYVSLCPSKSIAMLYYHHDNARYATLGTSETTKAPQNFTENSPYASLHMGTSKTLKDAGPILDSGLPRAKDEVSMERQNSRRRRD